MQSVSSEKNKTNIINVLSTAYREVMLTHWRLETPKRVTGKQYRPRSDATIFL